MAYDVPNQAERAPDDGNKAASGVDIARRYWREIERYGRVMQPWEQRGRDITKKYREEDRMQQASEKANAGRRFALLWSNIETLKPAIYAKLPTANVSRAFKDEDPVGRVAAELLERCSNRSADLYGYDETFRMVRDDRLLPGRGQAWVRYEATFEDVPAKGEEGEDGYEAGYKRLAEGYNGGKAEKVCVDHVHWCDFGHNTAKTWSDVWLVWRKVHWTRGEVRSRFGKEIAEKLTYDVKAPEDADDKDESGENKACLYEVWDKKRRKTCFLAKQHDDLIEDDDPPLKLHGFFPCPEPAYGSKTSDSLRPTPDYVYYQDQAEQIDDLTAKIAELTDWLIVKGFIPGGPSSEGTDAVERLLREKGKNILIPIESWEGWTERGGSRQIDWLPLDIIIQALQTAIESRQQLIQDVYQITGVADILRGQTDPDETLGAQQLKAQTGSRRVRNAKDEIARHARDIYRIVCEVVAEQFDPATLSAMTGYKYVPGTVLGAPQQGAVAPGLPPPGMGPRPPQPGGVPMLNAAPPGPASALPMGQPVPGSQGAPALPGQPPPQSPMAAMAPEPDTSPMIFDDQVVQRLRDDRIRSYSIDIETDSTIQPDEDAEKQRRVEFATMFGGFLKQAAELFTMGPMAMPLIPMVSEGLKFVVRGFRAGRQLEDAIDKALDQFLAMAKQMASQPPKPSPEEMKVQADVKAQQAELQFKEREAQLTHQIEVQKAQLQAQIETMKAQHEIQLAQQKAAFEQQLAEKEMALKAQVAERESALKAQQAERDSQMAAQQAETERAVADRDFAYRQQTDDRAHAWERERYGQDMAFQRERSAEEMALKRAQGNGASPA